MLGVGTQFQGVAMAHQLLNDKNPGKIIIVGAGPGGLSCGCLLQQQGIEFEILEASSSFGGRIEINNEFADFPIPMGAEWIETNPKNLHKLVHDSSIHLNIDTVKDGPDHKFVNSSWHHFFEQYIVPSIATKIRYNSPVQSIDYSGDQIVISTIENSYKADKVIVCVPLKILQENLISFTPKLPSTKQKAIKTTEIWDGFKAFFEFSESFYDAGFEKIMEDNKKGEWIFYDASLGQKTSKHIIGLFVVGQYVAAYASLSESELKSKILAELDKLFSNKAKSVYLKHTSKYWGDEPYIKSGYMTDHADWRVVRELGKSVNEKLFFAGGEYTDGEEWVSVHVASQSARTAVQEILN